MIDTLIAAVAATQLGNITKRQLLELGLSEGAIAYRVKVGRLYRLFRGVYAVGLPPTGALRWAAAAVLACGDRAMLSHGSAMTLWRLWNRWDRPFDVTVAGDCRLRQVPSTTRPISFAATSPLKEASGSPAQRGRSSTRRPSSDRGPSPARLTPRENPQT